MPDAAFYVAQNIINGIYDEQLDTFRKAIDQRKRTVVVLLKPGDEITFADNTRPFYLRGLKAVVTKVNGASVLVDIKKDPSYGRFAGMRNVRVPAAFITKG